MRRSLNDESCGFDLIIRLNNYNVNARSQGGSIYSYAVIAGRRSFVQKAEDLLPGLIVNSGANLSLRLQRE